MSGISTRLRQLVSAKWTREFIAFAASTYFLQGIQFVSQIITAYLLGPAQFGILGLIKLVAQYASILELGIAHGLHREVPLLRGRGDEDRVRTAEDSSLVAVMVLCLSVLGLAVLGKWCLGATMRYAVYVPSGVALVLATLLYHYAQVRLKASLQFTLVTQQQFVYGIVFLPLTVPLTWRWGIEGSLYGQTAAVGLSVAYVVLKVGFRSILPTQVKWGMVRHLALVGFPIMISGQVSNLMTSVDRWIIATFLGAEAVGYYSLAAMVFKIVVLVPNVVGQQLYPRMAEAYGRVPSSVTLWKWVKRWSVASLAFTVPVVVAAVLAICWGVPSYLPEYGPGIAPSLWLLGGSLFLPVVSAIGAALAVVNKQGLYLTIELGATGLNVLMSLALIALGWGIVGVAVATMASYIVFSVVAAAVGFVVSGKVQAGCEMPSA